jgi:hypothetical protein
MSVGSRRGRGHERGWPPPETPGARRMATSATPEKRGGSAHAIGPRWWRRDRTMPVEVGRVVALGASNLTRGFQTVVATARAAWELDVEVVAALGHGRSYGSSSRLVVRTLPGILESGLWRQLEWSPQVPTRALVTDVGNDILYGFSAPQILGWVDEVSAPSVHPGHHSHRSAAHQYPPDVAHQVPRVSLDPGTIMSTVIRAGRGDFRASWWVSGGAAQQGDEASGDCHVQATRGSPAAYL